VNARLPAVLSTADLPLAELAAAALDGELYPLGDCWCPVDEPVGPEARACAIAGSVPDRVIVERMTAAWVFGAGVLPARHQVCVDRKDRANLPLSAWYCLREVTGVTGDTVIVAPLRVTTPLRTVLDLCRDASLTTMEAVPVIRFLLITGQVGADAAAARLAAPRRMHRELANRRLAAASRAVA
jgi:hypothetical protein